MENAPAERFRVTDRALAAMRAAGLDPSRTFVVVQHVLGCGGSGYRLVFRETPLDGGVVLPGPDGVRISLDAYSLRRLEGAALDYDLEKETEGFWLDHPDAAFAAFC
jgi:Fe-S cluster assembly iron-binding protein IscA